MASDQATGILERPASRSWAPLHGLLIIGLVAAGCFVPAFRSWPLIWVAPLCAYGLLVAAIPPLRSSFHRWKFGTISRRDWVATLVLIFVSCTTLAVFQWLIHPDLTPYAAYLPRISLQGLVVLGIAFSIFNALFEEIIFRGILFEAVKSEWGPWVAVAGTALLFGYGHLRGYPPGGLGAVLAGIYGLALGWLRVQTGGLGLPVLAHVCADATIFTIVVRSGVL